MAAYSRCCKSKIKRAETPEGDYWVCEQCHRPTDPFSVQTLKANDGKHGGDDEAIN